MTHSTIADPETRMDAEGSKVTIAPLDASPEAGAEWDAYVAGDDDSSFCHLSGWRSVMKGALGHDAHYLVARDGSGRIVGGLPLVLVRGGVLGRSLYSMPFLSYGGPLGSPTVRRALLEEAQAMATELRAGTMEIRTRTAVDSDLTPANYKVTCLLPLADSEEAMWKDGLRSSSRTSIRKGLKSGLTAHSGLDQLDTFYRVFRRNMRDLGTPVLPRAFFEHLRDIFPEIVDFTVVHHEETPVAASAGFLWKGEFEMTWVSSIRDYNPMRPNMLLYWEVMRAMIERGAHTFNFGRCTPGSGTHTFKSRWGTTDEELPWLHWDKDGSGPTPYDDRSMLQTASSIWKKLPLALTNRLGPHLSRLLP